jgi:hypothetical protein
MNASRVAGLIRSWVDLYTRGMAPQVRAARRDEVDDDLWCHDQEAAEVGRSSSALGAEMLLRLFFGIPADLSWRLAQSTNAEAAGLVRSSSTSIRVIGTVAVLAGMSWTVVLLLYVVYGESAWTGSLAYLMMVLTVGAGLAFAATAVGLIWRFQEQLHRLGFLGGATAGLGGYAAAFDGAWVILLLPVGSAALAWDLARVGVLSFAMAMLHAFCAVAFLLLLVLVLAGELGTGLGGLAFAIPYPLSWIAIGTLLWRGVPSTRAGSGQLSDR